MRTRTLIILVALIPAVGFGRTGPRPEGTSAATGREGTLGPVPPAQAVVRRALRDYVLAQEVYFAEHMTYAPEVRALEDNLSEGDTAVVRTVVAASPTGHSAVARLRGQTDFVCGVAMGSAAPPLLDEAEMGNVTCRSATEGPVDPPVPSGLLLNISLRTLWIAFHGDSAELAASGPGILAPREDGFWRFRLAPDDRGLQMIVAESMFLPGRRDTVARWRDDIDPDEYDRLDLDITFVGPRHLGYSRYAERPDDIRPEFSSGFGEYGIVDPNLEPVELENVVGHPSVLTMLRAEEDYCDESTGWSWTIVRAPGRWVFHAFYNTGVRICGFGNHATSVQPDPGIVGHPPVALDLVRLVVPRARDAVLSPRRDAIVAVTSDSVYAFTVSPTAFGPLRAVAAAQACRVVTTEAHPEGEKLCSVPEIMMAEWALGRHVQRWTDEVRELLSRSPAESAR